MESATEPMTRKPTPILEDSISVRTALKVPIELVCDFRPFSSFVDCRLKTSSHLPSEDIAARCFWLPDKDETFGVIIPRNSDLPVKECASLPEFMHSRGWANVAWYIRDCEALWQAAAELDLLETSMQMETQESLQQRFSFRPCPLLSQEINRIEQLLLQQAQQMQGTRHVPSLQASHGIYNKQQFDTGARQSSTPSMNKDVVVCGADGAAAATSTREYVDVAPAGETNGVEGEVVFKCLEPGCGSARSIIWLATRHHHRRQSPQPDSTHSMEPCQAQQQHPLHFVGTEAGDHGLCKRPKVGSHHNMYDDMDMPHQARPADVSHQSYVPAQECPGLQQQQVITSTADIAFNAGLHPHPIQAGDATTASHDTLHHQMSAVGKENQVQASHDVLQDNGMTTVASGQDKDKEEGNAVSSVRWHTLGIDNWYAAISRTQELCQMTHIPSHSLQLWHAEVDSGSGAVVRSSLAIPNKLAASVADNTHIATQQESMQLETGAWHLMLCVRFLERSFLKQIPGLLAPGGFVLYNTFLDMEGTRKFGRPKGDNHLLQRMELASMFGPETGFEILRDDVALCRDGRELSMFVARKKF